MSNNCKTKKLDQTDYNELAIFLSNKFNDFSFEFWLDRFKIFWDKNPLINKNFDRGWLLLDSKNKIRGFFGNIPQVYQYLNKEYFFLAASSWFVEEEYHNDSLKLLNRYLNQNQTLIDTTASEKVKKILLKLKFKNIQNLNQNYEFLYFFPNKKLKSFLKIKLSNFFNLSVINHLIILIINFIFQINNNFKRIFFVKNSKIKLEIIKYFDNDFDNFWSKFIDIKKFSIKKNSEWLNWYFFSSEISSNRLKCFKIKFEEKFIGFCSIKLSSINIKNKKYKVINIIDISLLEESIKFYQEILFNIANSNYYNEEEIIYLKFNSNDLNIKNAMKKNGFFKRKIDYNFLYKNSSLNMNTLNFSNLDGDKIFFI